MGKAGCREGCSSLLPPSSSSGAPASPPGFLPPHISHLLPWLSGNNTVGGRRHHASPPTGHPRAHSSPSVSCYRQAVMDPGSWIPLPHPLRTRSPHLSIYLHLPCPGPCPPAMAAVPPPSPPASDPLLLCPAVPLPTGTGHTAPPPFPGSRSLPPQGSKLFLPETCTRPVLHRPLASAHPQALGSLGCHGQLIPQTSSPGILLGVKTMDTLVSWH